MTLIRGLGELSKETISSSPMWKSICTLSNMEINKSDWEEGLDQFMAENSERVKWYERDVRAFNPSADNEEVKDGVKHLMSEYQSTCIGIQNFCDNLPSPEEWEDD